MRIAYGIVKMSAHHIRNSTSYALWTYDLDKPREQREGLPQGAVVELIGVYSSIAKAMLAADEAIERA